MSDVLKDGNISDQSKIQSNISLFDTTHSLFSNTYHTFVVRKTERLASALYVITGFMPADEPVRGRLRVCALELITCSSNPSEFADSGSEKFEYRCTEIATILQTANSAGLISEMNAQLIGEEYASLASFVRTHKARIAERGHTLEKATVSEPKSMLSSIRHSGKSLLKKESISKRTESIKDSNDLYNRKNLILGLFNNKKDISIKDAVSIIPGVSEKTVQRDLLSLVSQGILIKKGSRRWTHYLKA